MELNANSISEIEENPSEAAIDSPAFQSMRSSKQIYVDKTKLIHSLTTVCFFFY
jgi:hypothetical protein